jgi:hypothetical protein
MSPRTIDAVSDQLATHFFYTNPNRLINGIAIGFLPEPDQAPPAENVQARLLIFVDTSAAKCEQDAIHAQVLEIAKEPRGPAHAFQIVRSSRFVALQTAQDVSVSPFAPLRFNVPLINAGSLGARVKIDRISRDYFLSSCHVLAFNGRVPLQIPILSPGLLDDATGGSTIGSRSYFVPIVDQPWPLPGRPARPGSPATSPGTPANVVDCALAEEPRGSHPAATLRAVTPATSIALGTPVTKMGRATGRTNSVVWIPSWKGPIDFSFGTRYFKSLVGTQDGHNVFASPGDSGSLITDLAQNHGMGLVMARGYIFDASNNFTAYQVLFCPLTTVAQSLVDVINNNLNPNPGLTPADLSFFVDR